VEAAVVHEDTYPARREEYGPVLASVLDAGRALSGMAHQKLLLRRAALRGSVSRMFADIDLLLCPAQPYVPLSLATVRTLGDQPALIAGLQRYTCPFNLTGHPTLTLPGGVTGDGLPLAFQLVAAHMAEATLLRTGSAYQAATRWHARHPEVAP
jgi:amidase